MERYIFLLSNGTSFVNFDAVTAVFRWKIGGKKSLYSANSCLRIHMLLYKQFRQLPSSVNGCMLFCLMMKETTRPYVIQSLQSSSIYLHSVLKWLSPNWTPFYQTFTFFVFYILNIIFIYFVYLYFYYNYICSHSLVVITSAH